MSIKSKAYELCKMVQTSPLRDAFRNTIVGLEQPHNFPGDIGTLARQMGQQLLGYLVVNRDRQSLANSYPPLRWAKSLQTDEVAFLEGGHRFLEELDGLCANPLLEEFPQFTLAVRPYDRLGYRYSALPDEPQLLDSSLAADLISSFAQHEAFSVARQAYAATADLDGNLSDEDLLKAVIGLERSLDAAGPMHTPPQIRDAIFQGSDHPLFFLIASLLSIRTSLNILNELVFQAIITNRLPIFDASNIIEFAGITSHASSRGVSLVAQPDERSGFMPAKLTFLRDDSIRPTFDLWYIESTTLRMSNDYGDTLDCALRHVNDDLNRFGDMLKHY